MTAGEAPSKQKKYSHRPKIYKKPAVKQVDGVGIKYARKAVEKKTKKKKNSDAPIELGTKRVSSHLKPQIVQNSLYKARDPRFDNKVGGDFDERDFQKNYSHVFELRTKEAEKMKKDIRKVKSEKNKEELRSQLTVLEAQNKQVELKQRQKTLEEKWQEEERALTKQGKKPFYLSKVAKKELALVDRFVDLKKNGLLKRYIEKKRKRNAAKEHKRMPERTMPDFADD